MLLLTATIYQPAHQRQTLEANAATASVAAVATAALSTGGVATQGFTAVQAVKEAGASAGDLVAAMSS